MPGFPGAPINATDTSDDPGDVPQRSAPACMSWALKRVFDIDIEHCPHCGGTLKIIAAIENPDVTAKILTHLGLSARAPPPQRGYSILRAPSRAAFGPGQLRWRSGTRPWPWLSIDSK